MFFGILLGNNLRNICVLPKLGSIKWHHNTWYCGNKICMEKERHQITPKDIPCRTLKFMT